ncbi:MAG TPA: putative zinc-binding metallopeptidase [Sporichthya sp.]|nr:putative zinc-binding metallopeptidase [Sporichthya sp.]
MRRAGSVARVRSFHCPKCGQLLFFENSLCLNCGSDVGFDRASAAFVLGTPDLRCGNALRAECNWTAPDGELCDCCELTRTRPNDDDLDGMAAFARAEAAKRRLLYQLDDLNLPVEASEDCPALLFDLLSSSDGPVTTGHADGVITIDLAEGDDGHREMMRVRLDEPYRTLLGHFRHEVGHYFWLRLVHGRPAEPVFRALFGDERLDYAEALRRHYASDPAPGWDETYVSVYATAHPWEDWAETFSHYLHIRDTLQTASAFGIVVAGPEIAAPPDPGAPLTSVPIETDDFDDLITSWLPLTYALNAVNRSMGKKDLYPFVLSPTVLEKLRLVHALVMRRQPARQR